MPKIGQQNNFIFPSQKEFKKMRNALEKLKLLGKMPNEDLDNDSQDILDLSKQNLNLNIESY